MTSPRKIELGPLAGHPDVTVAALHAPGALSGTYAVQLAPGASVPAHAHPNAETIVAYGPLDVIVAQTWWHLKAGEAIEIPSGVEHSVTNPRAGTVDYISIATPPWEGAPAMLVPASVAEAMARLDVATEWNGLSTIRAVEEHASEAEFSRARGDLNAALDEMSIAAAYALQAIGVMLAEREEAT